MSTRAENWLETYENASPKARFEQVESWLKEPKDLELEQQVFVFDNLFRILVHYNQIAKLKALYQEIQNKLPEAAQEIKGEVEQLLFNEAIYHKDLTQIETMIQSWSQSGQAYPHVFLSMLEQWVYLGQASKAQTALDNFLQTLPETESETRSLCHEWQREIEMLEVAQKLFSGEIPATGAVQALQKAQNMTVEEAEAVQSMMVMDDAGHLVRFRETLSQEPHLAFFHLRLPFCRFMQKFGFHYLTTTRILEVVWQFWGRPEVLADPNLDLMLNFTRQDLDAHLAEIFEQGGDLQVAVFLLWGLPWIYAFLKEVELCSQTHSQNIQKISQQARLDFLQELQGIIWTQAFVLYWPHPPEFPTSAQETIETLMHKSYQQIQPLSDDSEDSYALDALQEIHQDDLLEMAIQIQAEEGLQALQNFLEDIEQDLGLEFRQSLEIQLQEIQAI